MQIFQTPKLSKTFVSYLRIPISNQRIEAICERCVNAKSPMSVSQSAIPLRRVNDRANRKSSSFTRVQAKLIAYRSSGSRRVNGVRSVRPSFVIHSSRFMPSGTETSPFASMYSTHPGRLCSRRYSFPRECVEWNLTIRVFLLTTCQFVIRIKCLKLLL